MTDNRRRPNGLPTVVAAVMVWMGVMVLAPGGVAAVTMETLQRFTALSQGAGRLIQGSDGKLYGTTLVGGAADGGTVFRVNPDGTALEVLHAFACPSDGCNPVAGLTAGRDGKLYGTTQSGGGAGGGTVFRLNPDGTAFEVLHAFAFPCDIGGCFPVADLTAGSDGKFYGTTQGDGGAGGGTVFRLNPGGTAFEVLHAFDCESGCGPQAALTAGSDGKFYGTTFRGGTGGGGTVFRLNPDGTAFEVLHSFACGSNGDGCIPFAGLTASSDGKFYGTTFTGDAGGGGTVFRLNPDGTAFEVLHAFACESEGCNPFAGLTAGSDGKFYGTTTGGGAGAGAPSFG
jgi:uncharacterized repeat protein (TIGR03803 family)